MRPLHRNYATVICIEVLPSAKNLARLSTKILSQAEPKAATAVEQKYVLFGGIG
jgi:hypothetical protein